MTGLDQITAWIVQHPERTGVYAFLAARTVEREGLDYFATFNRCLGAAMKAGLSEASGRRLIYKGFASAAAGHIDPPAELEDRDV